MSLESDGWLLAAGICGIHVCGSIIAKIYSTKTSFLLFVVVLRCFCNDLLLGVARILFHRLLLLYSDLGIVFIVELRLESS